MNKKVDIAIEIAKRFNYREHAMKLDVPMLDGFKVIPSEKAEVVFAAGDDFCLEQFISDGALEENETFDSRVEKNIDGIKEMLKKEGITNIDENIQLLGNFSNSIFTFRIFLQYIDKIPNGICQVIVYFIEPKDNDFYQLTLSMGVTDKSDIDGVFNVLREKIVLLLEGIKYKEGVNWWLTPFILFSFQIKYLLIP